MSIISSSLFAAIHTSVPLNNAAYTIIEIAEIQGIIEKQIEARPYSAKRIIRLLHEIIDRKEYLSKGELLQVSSLIDELTHIYGTTASGVDELFSTGYLRSYSEETTIGASLGINIDTQQTALLGTKEIDSRNSVVAFIKGDLGNSISFNMNFGLSLDQLNNKPFLDNEFTIPADGFYLQLTQGGNTLDSIPDYSFFTGFAMHPEVAASFLHDKVTLRWGAIQRDWGVGLNNLIISKSAREFNGISVDIDITPWLRYSVITGSLGIFSLQDIDEKPFFSDFLGDRPYYKFDNNISAHRVELDVTNNFTLSLFEAVVWKKRFELGYLNPLSIYFFEQIGLGDIDDILAGLDFDIRIGNKVTLYGAIAASEMNSFKKIFTTPRNIMAFQGGIDIPLPIGNFSMLTFQWVHLSPFFYSHYPTMEKTTTITLPEEAIEETLVEKTTTTNRENVIEYDSSGNITINGDLVSFPGSATKWVSPDGRIEIKKNVDEYSIYETISEAAYVNKGENLGYPLHPNSTEFLAQLLMMFPNGYRTTASASYQARSGQYGFDIAQFMDYSISKAGGYDDKDFWNNVFEHLLTIKVEASKSFASLPIEINGSYRFTTTWKKDIISTTSDGRDTKFSSYNEPTFDHVVSVGARIFL